MVAEPGEDASLIKQYCAYAHTSMCVCADVYVFKKTTCLFTKNPKGILILILYTANLFAILIYYSKYINIVIDSPTCSPHIRIDDRCLGPNFGAVISRYPHGR